MVNVTKTVQSFLQEDNIFKLQNIKILWEDENYTFMSTI